MGLAGRPELAAAVVSERWAGIATDAVLADQPHARTASAWPHYYDASAIIGASMSVARFALWEVRPRYGESNTQ